MSANKDYSLSSYDYSLPSELIAQTAIEPRHAARLLIVDKDMDNHLSCRHSHVWDWQEELRPGDLIVVNDTRVLKARLLVRRRGGGVACSTGG